MPSNSNTQNGNPADDAAVGYRRPPVRGQFKRGQSGNPKGRPKGRPNVSTLTKALFNEPVPVREGGKTRRMPACEAMFRLQVAQAGAGDARSLFTVMDILEMTGRTTEISDEERDKRAMHLPASMTAEEMDLVRNPACEKQRERSRLTAESDPERYASEKGGLTVDVPPTIRMGDALAADRRFDEALTAYRSEIAACKQDLTADSSNQTAQDRFRRAVGRIGLLADALLHAGEFERAIEFADTALAEAATSYWVPKTTAFYGHVTTSSMWIRVVRAHACMLHGRVRRGARALHCIQQQQEVVHDVLGNVNSAGFHTAAQSRLFASAHGRNREPIRGRGVDYRHLEHKARCPEDEGEGCCTRSRVC